MTLRKRDLTVYSLSLPDINDKLQYIATITGNLSDDGQLDASAVTGQAVSGPPLSTTNDIVTFADKSGRLLADGGKKLPTSDVTGINDTQTLTNKTLTAPTINGGTHTAITSFGIRSTGAGAYDLVVHNTENLTAARTLTIKMNDADRTLTLATSATISGPTPSDTPAVATKYLTAYNATTGVFTQTQPSASDLSNSTYGTGRVLLDTNPFLYLPHIVGIGNDLRLIGYSISSSDPTTTQYPNDRDAGVHKNSISGNVYFVYNDGGTIKKVQLT